MGDNNVVSKPLGLVLMITAYMVLNGPSLAEEVRSPGTNITMEFTFNITVTNNIGVYVKNHTKIAGYLEGKMSSNDGNFNIIPHYTTVICQITNLNHNHSGVYWAIVFLDAGVTIPSNNKVQLIVQEKRGLSSTAPPMFDDITTTDPQSPTLFSSHIVMALVVSPAVLLTALLPFLVWCLVRSKDKQQPPQQRSSNLTVQETVDLSNNAAAPPPLIYSILDFPKRPSAVLEINPSDTEYAAVSYLQEKRHV